MRTAIFADLHDNYAGLIAVLDDAAAQKAEWFVFLGDAGHAPRILAALQVRKIPCVYGNWEVSGLRRLKEPLVDWVSTWPALIQEGDAVYCHATPDMPLALPTTASAAAWMMPGMSWSALFPRLHQNTDAVWNAFAWMETAGVSIAFHGHTHIQMAWVWELASHHLRTFTSLTRIQLTPGTRTIVSVGSAGAPDDGPWPRYAIYDDAARLVLLRCLREA
ncbi:MAG: metallophosphoesterase family protein [Caldilinea sp.]